MRYVIGVCFVTGFLIWDGLYHEGIYLDKVLRVASGFVNSVMHLVT